MREELLAFYTRPAGLTSAGDQAPLFDGLPRDVGALVRIVQGLLIHEHIAEAYGVTLTAAQVADVHIRPVERMLERIAACDPRPLAVGRPPAERLACCCRHVTLLLVAMLRSQGVPARARCGFGAYFFAAEFVDHWVCEYWNAAQERWVLVDAQVDARQRDLFKIELDTLDVPRDRFLVAGDAWRLCRAGKADPEAFGVLDMHGLWFIASNVIRDVAALNAREMLPWDVWGAMALSDAGVPTGLIDRLAALTEAPDDSFDELRAVYKGDESLRVPPTVFNAVLNRLDTI
jgi:hypothetical protein